MLKQQIIHNILLYIVDIPVQVQLVPEFTDGSGIVENTAIQINCSLNAHPAPVLSLWLSDGHETKKVSEETIEGLSLNAEFILMRDHNGVIFFCKARDEDNDYVVYSRSISYNVLCKLSIYKITG